MVVVSVLFACRGVRERPTHLWASRQRRHQAWDTDDGDRALEVVREDREAELAPDRGQSAAAEVALVYLVLLG